VISWIVVSVKTLLKKQEIADLYHRLRINRSCLLLSAVLLIADWFLRPSFAFITAKINYTYAQAFVTFDDL